MKSLSLPSQKDYNFSNFHQKNHLITIIHFKIQECRNMNVNRIKQILSSSAVIEVKYNGASIWIDELNADGKTVTAHLRGPFKERSIIEIQELQEEE